MLIHFLMFEIMYKLVMVAVGAPVRRRGPHRHEKRTVAFDRARPELPFELQRLLEGAENLVEVRQAFCP